MKKDYVHITINWLMVAVTAYLLAHIVACAQPQIAQWITTL